MRATRLICRSTVALVLVVGALVLPATIGHAATFRDNLHIDYPPETYITDLPCIGTVELTDTFSLILHSVNNSQSQHFGENYTGQWVVKPVDSLLPTYTGKYAGHVTVMRVSGDLRVATFTGSVMLKGSDGSSLHLTFTDHLTINANGEVSVQFSDIRCN